MKSDRVTIKTRSRRDNTHRLKWSVEGCNSRRQTGNRSDQSVHCFGERPGLLYELAPSTKGPGLLGYTDA